MLTHVRSNKARLSTTASANDQAGATLQPWLSPPGIPWSPDGWSKTSRCKRSKRGAHLLLQVRVPVLNGNLPAPLGRGRAPSPAASVYATAYGGRPGPGSSQATRRASRAAPQRADKPSGAAQCAFAPRCIPADRATTISAQKRANVGVSRSWPGHPILRRPHRRLARSRGVRIAHQAAFGDCRSIAPIAQLKEQAFVTHAGQIAARNANIGQVFRPDYPHLQGERDRAFS